MHNYGRSFTIGIIAGIIIAGLFSIYSYGLDDLPTILVVSIGPAYVGYKYGGFALLWYIFATVLSSKSSFVFLPDFPVLDVYILVIYIGWAILVGYIAKWVGIIKNEI